MQDGKHSKNSINNHNLFEQGGNAMKRGHSILNYKDAE